MINRFEQRFLIEVADRIAARLSGRSIAALELSDWMEEQDLGFRWDPDLENYKRRGVPNAIWEDLRLRLARKAAQTRCVRPDALSKNIAALSVHMLLDPDEEQIFALAVRAARTGPLQSLCNSLTDEARIPVEDAVIYLTGISPARVRKALTSSSRLLSSGLLHHEKSPIHGLGLLPSDRLLISLEPPSRGLSDILGKLFSAVEPTDVAWEDFEHLGESRDFAFRLLKGAIKKREKGVNILLHGPPGTGKTEFCKVLAQRLAVSLHAVGESDEDGDEPTRFERLQQLRLGQRLLADQGNSVILFDEMEDLFPGLNNGLFGLSLRRSGSKVHTNRLIEGNAVPTLWTTNDISDCDPAFLRRISFTLELRTPPVSVRARVWQELARKHRVPLSQEHCMDLAHNMEDAPALANSALRAARIARGGTDDVWLAATAISRAVRGGHTPYVSNREVYFDPELANADHDLSLIAERFVTCGPANTGGLCLSGPPGTGKSAFARYLAERLNMPVLERRASDLLDRFVGGSERNIADAFAEARDTKAFLVFDEADSLLRSREATSHGWEISQVNEMLTWMENHPLPFACTTNLGDQLDPATARRFSLRIGFLPLSLEQRRACFRRFFLNEPSAELQLLDQLTPGDFAVVAKRSTLLGIKEPSAIIAELTREQTSKPNASTPVGFRVSS
ncbi:AAA family ATPase [Yoonia sediminilitoris]|uniref:SpoVK/Ycf46/Vps4 family AAA+-type ATPase n=1 Tax=Yoonia sediminilitoris TaxID=1286148 RepID=A0A2T6K769_9RHOB|nr:ATP-binding protein [Yoonia sediminilitoris]PUB10559.1 SpoVK/Ycf46/Vps4 family AAA+-type ATPase [Yoonia sediminilitoris]RCW90060.1 SpoVK/Ycf46/Vps4 family AAA+-type ATPase [Yoonia sediminilitoris]